MIHGTTISTSMKFLPSIRQFQIIQKNRGSLQVLLVTKDGMLSPGEEEYLHGKLSEYLGGMKIDINLVESIAREESGKYRFIRSEISD